MTTQSALRLIIDSRPALAGATAVNNALKSITGNATRTATATNSMMKSMRPLLAMVGIAAAVKTIADFERSMLTLQGVTGKTAEQMGVLSDKARELGATTEFTGAQAADGMLELARAGFSAEEAMDAISDSLKLATATGMELAEASGLMANAIRQFGLDASDAAMVASTFVEVANSANTTVPELGEAMKYAGTVASSLGFSITETATAIGILGDRGVKGSMAGTQMRGSFLKLATQTDKLDAGLKKLNLTYDQVNPAQNGMVEIAKTLKGGIKSLGNELDAAGIMAEIFGLRNATAGLTLSYMSDQLEENIARNEELEDVHKKNAELIESSLIGQFKALISAIQEVFLVVGDGGLLGGFKALISTMTEGVRIVAGIKDSWDNASIAGKALGVALEVMISLFQVLIGMKIIGFLAGMAVALWKGVQALRALTLAQLRLNAAMKRNLFIAVATGALILYQTLSDGEEELISTEEATDDLNTTLSENEEANMAAAKAMGEVQSEAEELASTMETLQDAYISFYDQLRILDVMGASSVETMLRQKIMAENIRQERELGRELTAQEIKQNEFFIVSIYQKQQAVKEQADAEREANAQHRRDLKDQAKAEEEAEQVAQDLGTLFVKRMKARKDAFVNRLEEMWEATQAFNEKMNSIGALDEEVAALQESLQAYKDLLQVRERENELKQMGITLGTQEAEQNMAKLAMRDELLKQAEKEAEELKEAEEKAGRASEVLAEGFADAFTSMVTGAKSAKEAFKDMAQSIIQAMAEIYIKQQLISFFTAGTTATPTAGGDSRGAYLDEQKNHKRYASGGIVNRPTTFGYNGGTGLMGEAGAEAIMPLKRDSKGNLGVASSGEGGGSKVINVSMTVNTPNADSFRRSKRQIQSDLKRITT